MPIVYLEIDPDILNNRICSYIICFGTGRAMRGSYDWLNVSDAEVDQRWFCAGTGRRRS
jgi:hypothetical protein